jgi:integrase
VSGEINELASYTGAFSARSAQVGRNIARYEAARGRQRATRSPPGTDGIGTVVGRLHTFRRTVATWMDASGARLAEIANQLGHPDVNTTADYLGRRQAPTGAATVMTLRSSDSIAE